MINNKKHWWQEKMLSEDFIWRLNTRVKNLEKKIENNVRFNGLPRWQRILDGTIMWILALIGYTIFYTLVQRWFPSIMPK